MSTFDAVRPFLPGFHLIDWPRNGMDGRPTRRVGEVPGAVQDAEHLLALLETAGPDGAPVEEAILVGHSMSGPVIEAFARLHPERAAGLVFLDASIPPSDGRPKGLSRSRVSQAVRRAWDRAGLTRSLTRWAPHPERLVNVDVDNAALDWMIEEATLLRQRQDMRDIPVAVVVATLGLPFQGIWVKRQKAYTQTLRQSGAPRAELHVVKPATHLVQCDSAGRVASIIRHVARQADR
jgi:pimeloyl-ACP methyl ester carboxylesterase